MIARLAALFAVGMSPAGAMAQAGDLRITPAASATLPPRIATARAGDQTVYVDGKGRTLYGMDVRVVIGRTGEPLKWCVEDCAATWEAVRPPKGAVATISPAGPGRRAAPATGGAKSDWDIVEAAGGLQYLYKQANLVFVRRNDRAGSVAHDGEDGFVWNTLKYVPPAPTVHAPGGISATLVDGAYALIDAEGRLLFVAEAAECGAACAAWPALPAALASAGRDGWAVARTGDAARWVFRGKPVFVAADGDPASVPAGARTMRP